MLKDKMIAPPFFEIGVKNYLYGDRIAELALAADRASRDYGVDIIFTTPYADIRAVAEKTESIFVIAPHMDAEPIGRGLANVLPESIKAAGARGVMLNHVEKPLTFTVLERTIARARETGLFTVVCADTVAEARAAALLGPDIIVAEPAGLIGTGKGVDASYMEEAIGAVKTVNPDVMVLVSAGISNGKDVYNVMSRGCEATGTSSGVALAKDPVQMIDEMAAAVRSGWDAFHS